jgi:hypothetical protein
MKYTPKWFMCWGLGPYLVVPFCEILETLGSGTHLKELGHWRSILSGCILSLASSLFSASYPQWGEHLLLPSSTFSGCHVVWPHKGPRNIQSTDHRLNPLKLQAKINLSHISCSLRLFYHSDEKSNTIILWMEVEKVKSVLSKKMLLKSFLCTILWDYECLGDGCLWAKITCNIRWK